MADVNNSEQVDTSPTKKGVLGQKKLLGGLILLIVAVIATGAIFILKKHNKKLSQGNTQMSVAEQVPIQKSVEEAQKSATDFQKTLISIDKLIADHSYESALAILQQAEPKTSNSAEKYALEGRLGTIYSYKGQSTNAIMWWEKAQQTAQPGSDALSLSIALEAEKIGDKAKAVIHYQKYIELLKAHPTPTSSATIEQYQNKIKSLGG